MSKPSVVVDMFTEVNKSGKLSIFRPESSLYDKRVKVALLFMNCPVFQL